MPADRHDFLRRYSAAWAERAAARRDAGSPSDILIADVLERVVASMRTELASLPAEVASLPAKPGDATPIATELVAGVSWRSPVFNAGGRFNPFAGTRAEQMLATASLMETRGYADLAARYRDHAAADHPELVQVRATAAPPVKPSRRSRPTWLGPNLPPPDVTPFVAGPQMEFFA